MSLNGWALDVPEKGIPEWVSVYPNPVSNELNIRTGMVGGASFHVGFYNILGNLIMAKELHAGVNGLITVDLSDFAPGMYILRVGEADNVVVRKIFKQ
jgi:hypothetical protein